MDVFGGCVIVETSSGRGCLRQRVTTEGGWRRRMTRSRSGQKMRERESGHALVEERERESGGQWVNIWIGSQDAKGMSSGLDGVLYWKVWRSACR